MKGSFTDKDECTLLFLIYTVSSLPEQEECWHLCPMLSLGARVDREVVFSLGNFIILPQKRHS